MVCGPDLVTYLDQIPVFEWCVVGADLRTDVMFFKEIVLCVINITHVSGGPI